MKDLRVHPILGYGLLGAMLAGMFALAASARTAPSGTFATIVDGDLRVVGPNGPVTLLTRRPVGAAALPGSSDRVAITSGKPIDSASGGVRGQVSIVDGSDGRVLARTSFPDAILTGITYDRAGERVAFIVDYEALWVMRADGTRLRKIADAGAIAPVEGSTLFDPAFARDGSSVYIGVVEQTFEGEDDRLDNIWRISLDGTARPVTRFSVASKDRAWTVVRGPVPLGGGRLAFTIGRSGDRLWRAATIDRHREVSVLGPVPVMTRTVAADEHGFVFETLDHHTMSYKLYSMPVDGAASRWTRWCATGCEIIESGVDAATASLLGDAAR
jgi:hypothetical protein